MLVKTIVLTISYKEEKKEARRKKNDRVISVLVYAWNRIDNLIHIYHMAIFELDLIIFEKFIDIIIIKLEILNKHKTKIVRICTKMTSQIVLSCYSYTPNKYNRRE